MKKRIVIRAEGGAEKGLGHIIRSIALAEMLRDEYDIVFLSNYITPSIQQLLFGATTAFDKTGDYQTPEQEWKNLLPHLNPGDILVFDGYCFDMPIQQLVKQAGHKLVCIDDIHATPFLADAVINHSGGFSVNDYGLAPYSKLYTGLGYCLLRRPFREAAGLKKQVKLNNECLICFGGADPANDTLKTLEQLLPTNAGLNFHVVTGNAYQYAGSLLPYKTAKNIRFHSNLDAIALCDLMKQCSIAVTPPSTTAYEYLSVKGLLYLKVIASNQQKMFSYLTGNKLALPLEDFDVIVNQLNRIDIEALNLTFDGKQQERLLSIFRQL